MANLNSDLIVSKIQRDIDNSFITCCNKLFPPFCQVSGGLCHTAAIKTDGTLWTWGCNSVGQLGNGTTVSRCSPGTVAGEGTNWCQVSGGNCHTVAIKTDGTLWSWGYNLQGQLGNGTTVTRCSPGTVAGEGTTWCQVSASSAHTAAVKTDGTLWTWGFNSQGRLGDGTTVARCSPGTIAGEGTTWCQVSGGCLHTAAVKTDGTLWTWGSGSQGRLGHGTTVSRCSPGTVAGGGTTWCQVSGGDVFTSAIKTDGTLWTWGCNSVGQLGDGTTVSRCSPGTISGGGTTWCDVSAGLGVKIISIKTDGTLWTWGSNFSGQLGDGTTVSRCSPGTVAGGGTTWCDISNIADGTAAIKTDGTLWTWGSNGQGQLGNQSTTNLCSPSPLWITFNTEDSILLSSAVAKSTDNRQISVASTNELPNLCSEKIPNGTIIFSDDILSPLVSKNECWLGLDGRVLRSDAPTRTLFTWGSNTTGRLGDGTTVDRCSPGTIVGNDANWCLISGGLLQTAAIKTDGTLWTWGCTVQALGAGAAITSRCSPGTILSSNTSWCFVSVNCDSLAIGSDGTLWCWGWCRTSESGAAGISTPEKVGTGCNWCTGSAGDGSSAAITIDGTLWTWGQNAGGQLGNGNATWRNSPGTTWGNYTTWCQVSVLSTFMAAIKTDGTLWTWGCNAQGRLGDGTTVNRCSPGTIAGGGTTWCQVSNGINNSAAIKTDGTLWTWGLNIHGQLGDGTTVCRCSPGTVIGGGTTWCQVSGGNCHTTAVKTDGTLWTWGFNGSGRLGDGTTVSRCSPGTVAGGGTDWSQVSGGVSHTVALQAQ